MNIYFDANFPPSIPAALDKLEDFDRENYILSTAEEFGHGIKDPQLIKAISKKKGIWIIFDKSALKAHIKVLKRYKVPIFAFEYASHRYWEKTYSYPKTLGKNQKTNCRKPRLRILCF